MMAEMVDSEAGVVISSREGGEFTVHVRFGSEKHDVTEESTAGAAVNGVGGREADEEAAESALLEGEDPESVSS